MSGKYHTLRVRYSYFGLIRKAKSAQQKIDSLWICREHHNRNRESLIVETLNFITKLMKLRWSFFDSITICGILYLTISCRHLIHDTAVAKSFLVLRLVFQPAITGPFDCLQYLYPGASSPLIWRLQRINARNRKYVPRSTSSEHGMQPKPIMDDVTFYLTVSMSLFLAFLALLYLNILPA